MNNTKKRSFRKKTMIIVSSALAVAALITGTFAWSKISNVVNELDGTVKLSAALIDEFYPAANGAGGDKDVGIHNTGEVALYGRIMLNEYMEIYNELTKNFESIQNKSYHATKNLVIGADQSKKLVDADEWTTHTHDEDDVTSPANFCEEDFHNYWDWEMGGQFDGSEYDSGNTFTSPHSDVMTYEQWAGAAGRPLNTWVLCSDGYFYYSSMIQPGTSTGKLLDAVNNIMKPEGDFYYAIDVIMEVVSPNDLPAMLNGTAPSNSPDELNEAGADAKDLLNGIPVIVPTSGVKITGGNFSMNIGGPAKTLAFASMPVNATGIPQNVKWTSSAPTIASVNPATGEITAVAPGGPVTITVECTIDGTKHTDTIQVTVIDPDAINLDIDPEVLENGLKVPDGYEPDTFIYKNRARLYESTEGHFVSLWSEDQGMSETEAYCWFALADLFTGDAVYDPEQLEITATNADFAGLLEIVEKVPDSGEWFIRSAIYPANKAAFITQGGTALSCVFPYEVTLSQGIGTEKTFELIHQYDPLYQ